MVYGYEISERYQRVFSANVEAAVRCACRCSKLAIKKIAWSFKNKKSLTCTGGQYCLWACGWQIDVHTVTRVTEPPVATNWDNKIRPVVAMYASYPLIYCIYHHFPFLSSLINCLRLLF